MKQETPTAPVCDVELVEQVDCQKDEVESEYITQEELGEILDELDLNPICATVSSHTGVCCTFA